MTSADYSHRSTTDKLGIKSGSRVAFVYHAFPLDEALRREALERTARPVAATDEPADVVLIAADASTDVVALLREWRERIDPAGGIWLLTPKRGRPGYVNGTDLIAAGGEAGLVDNKICSVSDTVSGMRFVIRRRDRIRAD